MVGTAVGELEGLVGSADGTSLGVCDGTDDGGFVGACVGAVEGEFVGASEGISVGKVGTPDGPWEGA